jgi:hypothetical protein
VNTGFDEPASDAPVTAGRLHLLQSLMVSAVGAMPLSWQVPVFSGVSLV